MMIELGQIDNARANRKRYCRRWPRDSARYLHCKVAFITGKVLLARAIYSSAWTICRSVLMKCVHWRQNRPSGAANSPF